jgi:hypothetical protein
MKLLRYWYDKGVVYDLANPYNFRKTRSFKSLCRKLNSGEADVRDVAWESNPHLPRYCVHSGGILDRETPGKIAIFYYVDDCTEHYDVPEFYQQQMDGAIIRLMAEGRQCLSWGSYEIKGEAGSFRVPSWIKPGFVWSNHGNYWMWSEDKPQWNGEEYHGKSCRFDVPFFNTDSMPEWNDAKDSLHMVKN